MEFKCKNDKESGPKEETDKGFLFILVGNTISNNITVKFKSCKSSSLLEKIIKKYNCLWSIIIICTSKGPLSKNPKPCYKYASMGK